MLFAPMARRSMGFLPEPLFREQPQPRFSKSVQPTSSPEHPPEARTLAPVWNQVDTLLQPFLSTPFTGSTSWPGVLQQDATPFANSEQFQQVASFQSITDETGHTWQQSAAAQRAQRDAQPATFQLTYQQAHYPSSDQPEAAPLPAGYVLSATGTEATWPAQKKVLGNPWQLTQTWLEQGKMTARQQWQATRNSINGVGKHLDQLMQQLFEPTQQNASPL
ncbi:MAG: hypothetical protein SFZ03_08160 [Candidatus Melainabacteria bacterium]|nr:hypothetical protein [Candidatus Melainabacteria bacterium]